MKKDYPYWNHKTRKDWLRTARKQWSDFRKMIKDSNVSSGSLYYPKEVYDWLHKFHNEFKEMDKIMKEYYKNA